ncbi:MAG: ABC transporter permease [Candidatus Limnocylindrales bacterium]
MTPPTTEAIARVRPGHRRTNGLALVGTGLAEMLGRRRLTRYLVGAELKRTHANTAFGQLWWILDPLLQMAVYVFVVTVVFNKSTPDYPLFVFVAILPWKWFSATLNEANLSVTARHNLIRQVQFPKLVLPTSAVLAGTVSFGFGLIALALVYAFYPHRISIWILTLPLIAGVQFVFTLAIGILFAALNTFFRDIQNVLRHFLRLWFYLSPALYSLDELAKNHPSEYTILSLNPMAVLLDSYRAATWGTTAPNWLGLGVLLLLSLDMVVVAIYIFKRAEPAFARIL